MQFGPFYMLTSKGGIFIYADDKEWVSINENPEPRLFANERNAGLARLNCPMPPAADPHERRNIRIVPVRIVVIRPTFRQRLARFVEFIHA